jgi:peroxiredoxin
MAQLRHDYPKFQELNTEVVVIVPNGLRLIQRYVERHATPYLILSDRGVLVTERYFIRTRRVVPVITTYTPTVFLVDQTGIIRYRNYSASYIREPDNNEPLSVLAEMNSVVGLPR